MINCNLSDVSAAAIVESSLGKNNKLRKLDFTGVEMGPEFIKAMKKAFSQDPKCLEELVLASVKPLASMEALSEALIMSENLQYLDISGNSFNYFSVTAFSTYLKKTEVLEYLSISQCGLRGKVAEVIIDSIMINTSIKYLDMSNNRFTSRDYIIAAKLGRMVQGHLNLLHVDLSHNQLLREELFYITMCVRDSKNVQGFHLTGN